MKKNLVITNIFCQSLGPSLYRGSTVLNLIYLFFKKWGALALQAPPPARALQPYFARPVNHALM